MGSIQGSGQQAAHGVDFTTAKRAFADQPALIVFDAAHSDKRELRWWLLGKMTLASCWSATRTAPRASFVSSAPATGAKERNFMKNTGKNTPKPQFDADGYQIGLTSLNGEAVPVIKPQDLKPLRGGARAGAGRKPSGKVPVLLRLSPATAKRLRAMAKRSKLTLSEVAEKQLTILR